jgi:hypothetical protein
VKLPYLFPNELRIVCTGRGEHTPRELAQLIADQLDKAVGDRSGRFSVVQNDGLGIDRNRSPVVKHTRADGGVTFEFPACPTCSPGRPHIIRDDKLAAFMRGAPGKVLDVSLIP